VLNLSSAGMPRPSRYPAHVSLEMSLARQGEPDGNLGLKLA
jgi:hypothetical protein